MKAFKLTMFIYAFIHVFIQKLIPYLYNIHLVLVWGDALLKDPKAPLFQIGLAQIDQVGFMMRRRTFKIEAMTFSHCLLLHMEQHPPAAHYRAERM